MAFLTSIVTLLITAGLPLLGLFFFFDRDKAYLKPLLAGVIVYAVPQILSVLPPLSDMNAILEPSGALARIFGSALVFALLTEAVRYAVVRYYLTDRRSSLDTAAVGFGHWAIEALITVGVTAMIVVLAWGENGPYVNASSMLLSGLERLFVLPVMLLLSCLSFKAVKSGNLTWVAAGIAVHCLLNGGTNYLVASGVQSSVVIAMMGVAGLACGWLSVRMLTGSK